MTKEAETEEGMAQTSGGAKNKRRRNHTTLHLVQTSIRIRRSHTSFAVTANGMTRVAQDFGMVTRYGIPLNGHRRDRERRGDGQLTRELLLQGLNWSLLNTYMVYADLQRLSPSLMHSGCSPASIQSCLHRQRCDAEVVGAKMSLASRFTSMILATESSFP